MESIHKDSKDHVKAFLNGGESFMIGNYCAKKKKIGMGTFATIYHAIEKDLGREVAIKTIRVPDVKRLADNITREIKIMKELKHQNIVRLYDIIYDKDFDNVHLVMEYAPNGNLADFHRKHGSVGEIYVKVYMRQLAAGLQYLLKHGIVHRDLKPQNILMFGQYGIKLADFGFARSFEGDDMFNTFCGSPLYMAPELLLPSKGKSNKSYNSKADLWSIGIILYELLTGKIPSYSKTVSQLSHKLMNNDFKLPASIKVTKECRNLLDRLLIKDPVKRIEWNEFFNHAWFDRDEVMEMDNKLIQVADDMIAHPGEDFKSSEELLKKFSFNISNPIESRLPAAKPKRKLANLHDSFQEMRKSFYSKASPTPRTSSKPIPITRKLSPDNFPIEESPDLLTHSDLMMARNLYPENSPRNSLGENIHSKEFSSMEPSFDGPPLELDMELDQESESELFFSCEFEALNPNSNPDPNPDPNLDVDLTDKTSNPLTNIPVEDSQLMNLLDEELSQKLDDVMSQLNELWTKKKTLGKTEKNVSRSLSSAYDPELSFGKIMQDGTNPQSVDGEYQMVDMSFHEDYFAGSREMTTPRDQEEFLFDERGKYVVISSNPVNVHTRSDICSNRATYQDGFKYYLDNSINFLKESYTYFSNNRKSI